MFNARQPRSGPRSDPWLRLVPTGAEATGETDDASLVAGMASGAPWAATLAWHRHAPMVFGLFDRALGRTAESEDLTQDVFFGVFASIRKLRDPSALRSYIYSSALRRLRWHLRTQRVRRLLMLSDSGNVPDSPGRSVDSEWRELLQRFYSLLDGISAVDRTTYVLKYIEGLSLVEIAEATGASLATVKRRLSRAAQQVAVLAKADPELMLYLVPAGEADAT